MQIDQVGLPAGVVGLSRTDGLSNGAVVTLTSTGPGSTTRFALLWVPFGDTTAHASLAVTGNPKVWTFTPTAARYGTFRIQVIEDEGLPTEQIETRIFGIRLPETGILIPALNEVSNPDASLDNAGASVTTDSENNAIDYLVSTYNNWPYSGWWRAQQELYTMVETLTARVRALETVLTCSHQYVVATTLPSDTIDFNNGLDVELLLDETLAELTLVMPVVPAGRSTAVRIFIIQGVGGPFTISSWAGDFVFLDNAPPTLNGAVGTVVVLAGIINATSAVLRVIPTTGTSGFPG